MSSIWDCSQVEPLAEDRFRWTVPEGWQQGRGVFGGLVFAAVVRAMRACEPDATRVPRSLHASLPAPTLPGTAEIRVRPLRRGSKLTALSADVIQGDRPTGTATLTLAGPRSSGPTGLRQPPTDALAAGLVPRVQVPSPPAPQFTQNAAFHPVSGVPYSGGEPLALGWVGWDHPPEALGYEELAAMADIWWPAGTIEQTQFTAVATVAFALDWLLPPSQVAPPLLYRARTEGASQGYAVEDRELWAPDGRLVALNRQTIAWI